jgi:hypothetical protein
MSASVFISYATRDLKAATRLCQALEGRGFGCWLASRDVPAGENFQSAIVRAIRGARVMVLVFTHHANHSDEVAKELALASQQRMVVVPLRMEPIDPNDAFAYEFATRQWIDFDADWDAGLAHLVRRLGALLGEPAPPEPKPRRRAPSVALWAALALVAALIVGAVVVAPRLMRSQAPGPAPAASSKPAAPAADANAVPF